MKSDNQNISIFICNSLALYLEEAQAGIKIAMRNINTSDMQMTPPS